ncbi:MAG: class I SAM-dependent methyltransferase [Phenylobacterium sp.]|uniref:class I SAM-dependent methyltransferase n=1 Tax=Phenylobacterium sp. TaxID=1871053 RepID=UPI00391CC5D6
MSDESYKPTAVTPKPAPRDMLLSLDQALTRRSSHPGPFEQLFYAHKGRPADKWTHYLPFYDRMLAPYRGLPVRLLEIGVCEGGSLELWRKYFGPEAVIFGIDIDPECAERADAPNQVRIGSQADKAFLREVVREMGGLEIVLDDGSHVATHQRLSFEALWPLLNPGGLYVIEDLHTAYMPKWEGGLRRPGSAIELVKQLIDDMHAWYHTEDERWAGRDEIGSILIADSIVALRKVQRRPAPGHVWVGAGTENWGPETP